MLTMTDRLIHSTLRIECVDAQGSRSSGTGFFFHFLHDGQRSIPAIVTNKHVVHGKVMGKFHITMADQSGALPKYGSYQIVEVDEFATGWIDHPDPEVDLTIMPMVDLINHLVSLGKTPFFQGVSSQIIPNAEAQADMHPVEDVLMIGYPNGLWDTTNNVPIVRRGITATPAFLDYLGRKEFLIDAACFPGSSGSPVFIVNQGMVLKRSGMSVGDSRILFLGVLYAGPQMTTTGEIVVKAVPTGVQAVPVIKTMMNLGMCIKSERVMDFESILRGKIAPASNAA